MKLQFIFVAILIIVSVTVVFWQPAKTFILQDSCLDNGGKWAVNGNYCIHRQCAEDNACKPNYRNNATCEALKIGISKNELYFHLGMPESNTGNVYMFTGGGAESRIKATINNGEVTELACRT